MLVLSRRIDERIVIGENIRITVVNIRGNQVRLGIEAPPSVNVMREELILRSNAEHAPFEVGVEIELTLPSPAATGT